MTDANAHANANELAINLAHHRAWIAIAEQYLRLRPKADIAALLADLLEAEQQCVEELAHSLRLLGVAPALIETNETLVQQALMRRNFRTRMQFVDVGLQRTLAWYEQRLHPPDDPHHLLWRTLYELQAPVAGRVRSLLSQIE